MPRKLAIRPSSATDVEVLPTSAGEPAECTPIVSMASLAAACTAGWADRLR